MKKPMRLQIKVLRDLQVLYLLFTAIGSVVPCFGSSVCIYEKSELLEDLDVMEAIYLNYAPDQTAKNRIKTAEYFNEVKRQIKVSL